MSKATDFPAWLQEEMNERGWNQSDLARSSNLTQGAISNVLNKTREPGYDFCVGIARAFDIPVETVFRRAKILPEKTNLDEDLDELVFIANRMTLYERRRLLAIARVLLPEDREEDKLRKLKETFITASDEERRVINRVIQSYFDDYAKRTKH